MQTADGARESYDHPRWKLQQRGGGLRCRGRGTASAGARGKAGSRKGGLAVPKVRGGQAVLGVKIEIWCGAPNSEADRFSDLNLDCGLIVRKQRQSIPHRPTKSA